MEELETRLNPSVSFLGVGAGDATSSDAILWTRAQDSSTPGVGVNLTALVSKDQTFATGSFYAGSTDATQDYTIHIDATGLQAGTRYYYRFTSVDALNVTTISQVGTFVTAPSANTAAPLHFGFTGDADGQMRPYPAADAVTAPGTPSFAGQQFDNFIWLGDTMYETASGGAGPNSSPATPSTSTAANITPANLPAMEAAYWAKYRQQLQAVTTGSDPGLQTFFSSTGHDTLLDNHELGNKQVINGGAPQGSADGIGADPRTAVPDTPGPNDVNSTGSFMNQTGVFKTLIQAYTDYQPIRVQTVNAPGDPCSNGTQQLYFSQQWGANDEFINLDDRSYRDIRLKKADNSTDDTGPRADNPNRTMLGATELAWFEQTLLTAQSNGVIWKFVSVSSPIDQIGAIGSGADGGKSWMGGYRYERNQIMKFIADNHIDHVVFLTTDDHQVRVNELLYSPTGATADQSSYVPVPGAFQIVAGPIGATGPDTITDHSIANIMGLAQSLANTEYAAGVNPIGLDPNFPGLKNVTREGDPSANANRSPFDFYSPDTFNYTVLDVDASGHNLTVTLNGLSSYAVNLFPQPDASNPVRQLLQFTITTDGVQAQANSFNNLTEGSATVKGTVSTFTDPTATTFAPGDLLVSYSVYSGSAASVTVGQALPGGGTAVANGAYPGVFANEAPDASFGITSPIFLEQLTTAGAQVGSSLNVTAALGNTLATSFPSKSELALNLSADGTAVTFMAYEAPTNALDISNSNTPNHVDPTNPVGTSPVNTPPTQRAVAQIDANGNVQVTPVNDYSGNNGRAAVLGATGDYYMVGNAGNGGNISIKGVNTTANSTTLTITGAGNSTTLLEAGQPISGGNIPASATVVSITDATHFVISAAPITTSASSFTATISQTGTVLSMLSDNTGVQMIAPGAGGDTTVVGQVNGTFGSATGYQRGFSIGQTNPLTGLPYGTADKTGKDDNFRGLTIFNNTLYVTKGSGSNGVDTVYQVGAAGSLPSFASAGSTPINVLPGFPSALARGLSSVDSTTTTNGRYNANFSGTATEFYPFGIWFANATTLYVADEGAPVTTSGSKAVSPGLAALDPNAGLEKWSLINGVWQLDYTLQAGLNLGAAYGVASGPNGEVYPSAFNPATAGLRNLTGRVNNDGTVSLYAVTSTSSTATDQGADPNKLVAITDNLLFTTAAQASGESFTTLKAARFGEVLRGVSFTPNPTLDHYTASINWGDGTPATAGTVSLNGATFSVAGTHTYAEEGSFPVTTTITHQGISTNVAGTATVADAAVTVTPEASPLTPINEATSAGTVEVAQFTDPGNPTGALDAAGTEYSAVIDWGDGGPTTTVDSTGGGISLLGTSAGGSVWSVQSSHVYAEEGSFTITVSVQHDGLAATAAVATDSIVVNDPAVTLTAVAGLTPVEATSTGTVEVARFVDPGNPTGALDAAGTEYIAVIDWGDRSPTTTVDSTGGGITLVSSGPGGSVWSVKAAHSYADATSEKSNVPYGISVALTHDGLAPTTMVTTSAIVSDPNPVLGALAFAPHQLDATHGQAVPGQTVTLTTPYSDVPNDGPHTVTIGWGDGSPNTTVTAAELTATTGAAGLSHMYTAYGTFTVTETVKDDGSGVSTQSFTVNIVPVDLQPCAPTGMFQLVVGGTQFDDDIHVNVHSDHGQVAYNVEIHTNNGHIDLGNFQTGDVTVPSGLCQVLIFDLNGNDNIHANTNQIGLPVGVFGGNGNDQVELGAGNNTVMLGNGNDQVQLGNGNNTVILGAGSDSIHAGDGTNSIKAGAAGSTGNVDVHLGTGANDFVMLLGNGNDSVQIGNGNYATVTINGNGNDSVEVGNGNYDSVSIVGNGNDSVKIGNGLGDLVSVVGDGDEDIQTGNGAGVLHLAGTGHNKVKLGKGWTQM